MTLGLCECGCGHPTKISTVTDRARGWVKGEPVRFLHRHRRRNIVVSEYRRLVGNRRLHRARAEKALGKPLPLGTQVHHADGSRSDTAPLVICPDDSYHRLLHARMRVRSAGADPNSHKICGRCKVAKPFADFHRHTGTYDGLHYACRECSCAYQRQSHARRRQIGRLAHVR